MGIAKARPSDAGGMTPRLEPSGDWSPLRLVEVARLRLSQIGPLRAFQIALGLIWVADGALQFQPYMFSADFLHTVIASNAQGQPWIIHETILALAQVAMPYRVLFNACFALVQVAIGLGLVVSPRTVRPALAASFGWALVVWFAGEGLGLLLTGTASPLTGAPGAVLLYALLGVLVWPAPGAAGRAQSGPAGRHLAGRVTWGLLWLLLAALMLLPLNSAPNATSGAFSAAAAAVGSGPLAAIDAALAGLTAGRGLLLSVIAAGIMAEVGVMVLVDWHPKVALAGGAAIGAFLFLTSEFLGGILTGQGTDPNSGPLLVLFAALLWVRPLPVTTPVAWGRLPLPEPLHQGRIHHG